MFSQSQQNDKHEASTDANILYKFQQTSVQTEAVVRRCSVTKVVLRNFAKFTGKHLCIFFNKVAGLRPASLLKNTLWHRYFPVNFAEFLRTPYFIEHLWMTASE